MTVAWMNCYQDYSNGGLGLRSLRLTYEATGLEQCWSVVNDTEIWDLILRDRVFRNI